MTCYEPVKVFRSANVNPDTGKRPLEFGTRRLATGVLPVDLLTIACGRCRGCRSDRAADWGIRCSHEVSSHKLGGVFVTLTYDSEHLPANASVVKRHVQLWQKRLREAVPRGVKLRFYGAAEYGERRKRPHYHYLIYGYDFPDRKLYTVTPLGHRLWSSPLLEDSWGMGHARFGAVSFESARYCAGYIMDKELGGDFGRYDRVNSETGETWKVEPEFSTMSLKPGLGYDWFKKFGGDVWPGDFVVIDGRKMKPPKYYETLIDEALLEEVKRKRKLQAADEKARWNNSPVRLVVREECFIHRLERREKRVE